MNIGASYIAIYSRRIKQHLRCGSMSNAMDLATASLTLGTRSWASPASKGSRRSQKISGLIAGWGGLIKWPQSNAKHCLLIHLSVQTNSSWKRDMSRSRSSASSASLRVTLAVWNRTTRLPSILKFYLQCKHPLQQVLAWICACSKCGSYSYLLSNALTSGRAASLTAATWSSSKASAIGATCALACSGVHRSSTPISWWANSSRYLQLLWWSICKNFDKLGRNSSHSSLLRI
jgi:hypothetical protein